MNLPLMNDNMHTVEYWVSQTPESESWTDIYNIVLFRNKENETTISGYDIIHTMLHDYGHFLAYSVTSYVEWVFEWERFCRIHTHDFERIYTALYTDYAPLENYNKTSTITDSGSDGAKDAAHAIISTIEQVADDTVSTASPYIPQNKTTTYGKTEHDNTRTENMHGNIGVTTSMTMLTEELNGRLKYNMIETIVRLFAEMELI